MAKRNSGDLNITDLVSGELKNIVGELEEVCGVAKKVDKTSINIDLNINGLDELDDVKEKINGLFGDFNKLNKPQKSLSKYFQSIENGAEGIKNSWNKMIQAINSSSVDKTKGIDGLFEDKEIKSAALEVYKFANAFTALGGNVSDISSEISNFVEQIGKMQTAQGKLKYTSDSGYFFDVDSFKQVFAILSKINSIGKDNSINNIFGQIGINVGSFEEVLDVTTSLLSINREYAYSVKQSSNAASEGYSEQANAARDAKKEIEALTKEQVKQRALDKYKKEKLYSDYDVNDYYDWEYDKSDIEKYSSALKDLQEQQERALGSARYYQNRYAEAFNEFGADDSKTIGLSDDMERYFERYVSLTSQVEYVQEKLNEAVTNFDPTSVSGSNEQWIVLIKLMQDASKYIEELNKSIGSIGDDENFKPLLSSIEDIKDAFAGVTEEISNLQFALQNINQNYNIKIDNSGEGSKKQQQIDQFLNKTLLSYQKEYEKFFKGGMLNSDLIFSALSGSKGIRDQIGEGNLTQDYFENLYGKAALSNVSDQKDRIERIIDFLKYVDIAVQENADATDAFWNELKSANKSVRRSRDKSTFVSSLNKKYREEEHKVTEETKSAVNDILDDSEAQKDINELSRILELLEQINQIFSDIVEETITLKIDINGLEELKEIFNNLNEFINRLNDINLESFNNFTSNSIKSLDNGFKTIEEELTYISNLFIHLFDTDVPKDDIEELIKTIDILENQRERNNRLLYEDKNIDHLDLMSKTNFEDAVSYNSNFDNYISYKKGNRHSVDISELENEIISGLADTIIHSHRYKIPGMSFKSGEDVSVGDFNSSLKLAKRTDNFKYSGIQSKKALELFNIHDFFEDNFDKSISDSEIDEFTKLIGERIFESINNNLLKINDDYISKLIKNNGISQYKYDIDSSILSYFEKSNILQSGNNENLYNVISLNSFYDRLKDSLYSGKFSSLSEELSRYINEIINITLDSGLSISEEEKNKLVSLFSDKYIKSISDKKYEKDLDSYIGIGNSKYFQDESREYFLKNVRSDIISKSFFDYFGKTLFKDFEKYITNVSNETRKTNGLNNVIKNRNNNNEGNFYFEDYNTDDEDTELIKNIKKENEYLDIKIKKLKEILELKLQERSTDNNLNNENGLSSETTASVQPNKSDNLFEESSGQMAFFDGLKESQKEIREEIQKTDEQIKGQLSLFDNQVDLEADKTSESISSEGNSAEKTYSQIDELTSSKKRNKKANQELANSAKETANSLEQEGKSAEEAAKEIDTQVSSIEDLINNQTDDIKGNIQIIDPISDEENLSILNQISDVQSDIYQLSKLQTDADKNRNKVLQEEQKIRLALEKSEKRQSEKINKSLNDINKSFNDRLKRAKSILNNSEYTNNRGFKDRLKEIIEESRDIDKSDIDKITEFNNALKNLLNGDIAKDAKQGLAIKLANLRKQIAQTLKKNTKMGSGLKEQYISIDETISQMLKGDISYTRGDIQKLIQDLSELEAEMIETGQSGDSAFKKISNRLQDMNSKFIAQYLSWQDIIRYIRTISSTVIELDTALTELRKVSDASTQRLQQSFQKSSDTAKELGRTITDVINVTSDWSRLGYSIDEAEELAKVTTLFQNVGDNMDADSASSYMVSTLQGFELEADKAIEIADKFNEVANNFAIDTQGIGEALKRSAASFNASNTDLSESIALITATNAVVQDPESVGTMWKTKIFTVFMYRNMHIEYI